MSRKVKFNIINGFLAFLLAVILLFIALCSTMRVSFFNSKYTLGEFTSDLYVDNAYNEFMDKMKELAIPSYIDSSCYESIFTKDRFKFDVTKYFQGAISQKSDYSVLENTSDMQLDLKNNLVTYGNSIGTEITDAVISNISEYTQTVFKTYDSYVSLSYINYYASICEQFGSVVNIALAVATALSIIITVVLFFSKYGKRNAFDYLSYAFGGSCLMMAILPTYSYATGFYRKFNITPKYVYDSIVNIVIHTQKTGFVFAGILLILCVAFAITAQLVSKKKKLRK